MMISRVYRNLCLSAKCSLVVCYCMCIYKVKWLTHYFLYLKNDYFEIPRIAHEKLLNIDTKCFELLNYSLSWK